jgi:4-amino-4-deoxy-L-arabinose transferase-like glycosyltransferase
MPLPARVPAYGRYYPALAAGVLALALFNLTFRLGHESVREWDESLYATSAWEMSQGGDWVGHTFHGVLDYYNTKPPLNLWLIAAAFKAFGVGLVSLRLTSVTAAWCTVAVLIWWTRRAFGEALSLSAGLVLSTTFAFLYGHAARTANTDSLNTLLILLAVVVVWLAREAKWRLLWLGPILAAVFLLRGMAVVLPVMIVAASEAWGGRLRRDRVLPAAGALLLCLLPIAAWAIARWRLDGWQFIGLLFWYDFVARSVSTIEEHPGSVFYYLNILQKHHYDWLVAGFLAWLLFPVPRCRIRELGRALRNRSGPLPLLAAWGIITLLVPTAMATKLPWYLHPFYPVFAIAVGAVLAHAGNSAVATVPRRAWRRVALVVVVALTFGVAEGKLIYFSYRYRDLASSSQGLLLAERGRLEGRQVFSPRWERAEIFVLEALVGGRHRLTADVAHFLGESRPGDYLLVGRPVSHEALSLAGSRRRSWLYRRIN